MNKILIISFSYFILFVVPDSILLAIYGRQEYEFGIFTIIFHSSLILLSIITIASICIYYKTGYDPLQDDYYGYPIIYTFLIWIVGLSFYLSLCQACHHNCFHITTPLYAIVLVIHITLGIIIIIFFLIISLLNFARCLLYCGTDPPIDNYMGEDYGEV